MFEHSIYRHSLPPPPSLSTYTVVPGMIIHLIFDAPMSGTVGHWLHLRDNPVESGIVGRYDSHIHVYMRERERERAWMAHGYYAQA